MSRNIKTIDNEVTYTDRNLFINEFLTYLCSVVFSIKFQNFKNIKVTSLQEIPTTLKKEIPLLKEIKDSEI